jgi:hypothetical protein
MDNGRLPAQHRTRFERLEDGNSSAHGFTIARSTTPFALLDERVRRIRFGSERIHWINDVPQRSPRHLWPASRNEPPSSAWLGRTRSSISRRAPEMRPNGPRRRSNLQFFNDSGNQRGRQIHWRGEGRRIDMNCGGPHSGLWFGQRAEAPFGRRKMPQRDWARSPAVL